MQRHTSFLVGLGLGVAAVAAGYLAITNLPASEPSAEDIRDRLLEKLDGARPRLERALPDPVRTRSCAFGPSLAEAQRGSVKPVKLPTPGDTDAPAPVDPSTFTYPTPEARLHAMLESTTCKELGRLDAVDTTDLADLPRSSPMLVRRAWRNQEPVSARAWAVRTWALGHDLIVAQPEQQAEAGSRLVAAGADGLAFWLIQSDVPQDLRQEGAVLAAQLLHRSPVPRALIERRATRMLRRGLTSPIALNLDGEQLTAAFETAGAWWGQAAEALETPGAPVPAAPDPPPGSTPDTSGVLIAMTDTDLQEWFEVVRHAERNRLAVALLLEVDRDACQAPWAAEPPQDPVSGAPARWNAATCTLTLGDTSWGPAPDSAEVGGPPPGG